MLSKVFKVENPIMKEVLEWIEIFVIAFLITLVIRTYIIEPTQVSGSSMEPNLHDGDRLIVDRFETFYSQPKRGDIVVFEYNQEKNFIKRVIGLPGDVIDLRDGKVFVNNQELKEPYVKDIIKIYGDVEFPITVTKDHYFVMGDNRNNSQDSRFSIVGDNGLVPKSAIRGPVSFRFWPLDKIGTVSKNG